VAEAEEAREAMVHDPETWAVLEQPTVDRVQEASAVYNISDEVAPPVAPAAEPAQETAVAPQKATARPKKPAPKKEEYKQVSFLDM